MPRARGAFSSPGTGDNDSVLPMMPRSGLTAESTGRWADPGSSPLSSDRSTICNAAIIGAGLPIVLPRLAGSPSGGAAAIPGRPVRSCGSKAGQGTVAEPGVPAGGGTTAGVGSEPLSPDRRTGHPLRGSTNGVMPIPVAARAFVGFAVAGADSSLAKVIAPVGVKAIASRLGAPPIGLGETAAFAGSSESPRSSTDGAATSAGPSGAARREGCLRLPGPTSIGLTSADSASARLSVSSARAGSEAGTEATRNGGAGHSAGSSVGMAAGRNFVKAGELATGLRPSAGRVAPCGIASGFVPTAPDFVVFASPEPADSRVAALHSVAGGPGGSALVLGWPVLVMVSPNAAALLPLRPLAKRCVFADEATEAEIDRAMAL